MIKSISVILLVQIALASVFLFDPVAKALGWKLGANTSPMEYLYFTKIITRPGKSGMAADHGLTFFWGFISEKIYN